MRTWRRLLGAALTDPRRAVITIGAIAITVVATTAALAVVTAPSGPSLSAGTARSAVPAVPAPSVSAGAAALTTAPASDRPVLEELTAFAARLAAGPRPDLTVSGIGSRYLPDPAGASIRGEFFKVAPSGTCFVVTFTADRSWLAVADPSGIDVAGPTAAAATRCADVPRTGAASTP